ncbi:MAG TPA: hypothetical protein VEV18_04585, partial [Steroidobacteraceae bacterium]|nr:hypothetical protein [Steroidobacteraceae bacterium]
ALRAPASLSVLPVLRSGAPTGRSSLPSAALPPRLLYEGPVSGAGEVCDWSSARELARRTELILAGGLDAGSVGAAIAAVGPFGVDVSSGVEAQPGIKSAEKIVRFVEAARMAFGAQRGSQMFKQENSR